MLHCMKNEDSIMPESISPNDQCGGGGKGSMTIIDGYKLLNSKY